MPLDPQVVSYIAQLQDLGARPASELPLQTARSGYDAGAAALFGPADEVASVEELDAAGVPVRVFRPSADDSVSAVVYLHGGGWVVGGPDSHDPLCRTLAARSGYTVIAADYRRAPEHPYPAAIEDAWTVARWAAERFSRLAVAGDSAGGQLAASVALRAREGGVPLALQALIYPVTDHPESASSYGHVGDATPLNGELMWWFWSQYLTDASRAGEPDCSPLRAADLSGLPPALILTAEYDPLRAEGEAYGARLREAGVPATVHRYEGLIHGFIRMPAVLDRASGAIDEVADAIADALAPARRSR
ncbi:MAG TPA: alpha/beta hydrolase [Solirubrobacteraceae bacterium]